MDPSETRRNESLVDRVFAACCSLLPNCGRAISLVETACERPLTARERLQLKYDRRLCPFCGCAAGKFASVENRLKDQQGAANGQ